MSNVMKLANAIIRQNGLDTAKRSAAFDELRKLAEKSNSVSACVAAVSEGCERAGLKMRDAMPFAKAYAQTSYACGGDDGLSQMAHDHREENAVKRKALAKANAAKAAATKLKKSQQQTTNTPAAGDAGDDGVGGAAHQDERAS